MLDHQIWLAVSIIWLAVWIVSFIEVWKSPQLRIYYAAKLNVNFPVALVLLAVISTYVWNHGTTSVYIWLASLPFIFTASYIARRHRRLVMDSR